MVKSVQIKNFKSVVDLSLDLGTFNVLIGENGCGKSNILEAIAFGAAASADKLDYEFLGSRGLRVTNPEFMFSAFSNNSEKKKIGIYYKTNDSLFDDYEFLISTNAHNPKKWVNESKEIIAKGVGEALANTLFGNNLIDRKVILEKIYSNNQIYISKIEALADQVKDIATKNGKEDESANFFKFIFNDLYLKDRFSHKLISDYVIYAPEQSSLRKFEETNQIYPLGIKGEGLFQYLKEFAFNKKNKKHLAEIRDNLMLLDWYENFDLPDNLMSNEFSLKIKDKYLYENLQYFDQRSTNEGFLFLLFYLTLFISKDTPTFFAIDNIDASFNPKLCIQLIKTLAALAKKHKKQVIVTTHNPAILDGLNLKDDTQRLFVVSRNADGHTRAERINYNEKRTMKLSEVWTKGFIGGLPSNF